MANQFKDSMGRPIVVVTGMGVVTSLGQGKEDNWKKLTSGVSGIHRITRFPIDGLKTTISGTVDFLFDRPVAAPELSERLAALAAEEAVAQSGIGAKADFPGPLFCAVPPVEIEWPQRNAIAAEADPAAAFTPELALEISGRSRHPEWHEMFLFGTVADRIADRFGTKGLPISVSTACASGGTAIQLGAEAIRRGDCEAAPALGTDGSGHAEPLIRFSLLSALSTQNENPTQASKPFSKNRDGFVIAEGAGALVLESLEHATKRGAKILGVVAGFGEVSDSFHRTRSSPDGKPIIACINNALKDAGIGAGDIDYINAHGTSTPENDKMETLGVTEVFGKDTKIPISSNKSMIGHTLSAAGAVEAVFSLLTLAHQRIPPTINYTVPDPLIPLDVVPNTARDAKVTRVLSNSFGFGGQNVSIVLSGEPA